MDSIRKFEFARELGRQEPKESTGGSELLGNQAVNFNRVQQLTSQTLQGALFASQSNFNETKGAELALHDLLKSSSSRNQTQRL